MGPVTDAAPRPDAPKGTSLLPPPLTEAELDAAPVLESLDQLIIEDLTEEEHGKFMDAVLS